MSIQQLEKLIRDKMDTFPTKTRRVAEYLLGNSSEVAFHSISEVADRLSVSKAQLVRVARMLGFDGYSGLRDFLKKNLLEQVIPSSIQVLFMVQIRFFLAGMKIAETIKLKCL